MRFVLVEIILAMTLAVVACSKTAPTHYEGIVSAPVQKATLTVKGDTAILDITYLPGTVTKPVHDTFKVLKNDGTELDIERADHVKLLFIMNDSQVACAECEMVYGGPTGALATAAWVAKDGLRH